MWSYIVWVLLPTTKIIILASMFLKKLHKKLPAFSLYLGWTSTADLFELFIWKVFPNLYTAIYVACDFCSFLLLLAVIYELFSQFFGYLGQQQRMAARAYQLSLLIAVVAALATAIVAPDIRSEMPWFRALLMWTRSEEIIVSTMILVMFVVWKVSGLGRRHYAFGIALGTALEGFIYAGAHLLRNVIPQFADFRYVPQIASCIAIGSYAYYFLLPGTETRIVVPVPKDPMNGWSSALDRLIRE